MPETGPTATLVPDPGGATADLAVDRTTLPSGKLPARRYNMR